ncbi:MAG: DsbA family protein [Pseudomonadota bacterium]
MIQAAAPARSVLYVMDPYCGWCWGFAELLAAFEAANGQRVAFTAISGGLFVGERAAPLSAYPYIEPANARITELTGARFGEPYLRQFARGTMVMDSMDAGAGLAALRELAPARAVYWAHQLLAAFYERGLSLSLPSTIAAIGAVGGLDPQAVLQRLADGSARAAALADFALARQLGVSSYPSLLFIDGATVHRLPATGATLAELNAQLTRLLEAEPLKTA